MPGAPCAIHWRSPNSPTREVVPLNGAWTACGAWFLLDAVEALARSAAQ